MLGLWAKAEGPVTASMLTVATTVMAAEEDVERSCSGYWTRARALRSTAHSTKCDTGQLMGCMQLLLALVPVLASHTLPAYAAPYGGSSRSSSTTLDQGPATALT